MAQTSPTDQRPERVSARQRRIEEQRQKIELLRRGQRRKRALWGTAIIVLVALAAALAFLFIKPPAPAQGRQIPIEGTRTHLPQGTDIHYKNRPPSSGDHYDETAGYGVFDKTLPTGNWVHNLEHGAVVVLYRPDLCDQTCLAVLRDTYNAAPSSQYFPGVHKMIVEPYEDMDHAVAAVAWGWLDEMDAADRERILSFYRAHVDRGPEVGAL